MAISALVPAAGPSTTLSGAVATAPGATVAAPDTAPSPSTSVTLSALSAEAGIVATLNGGNTYQTYDASGLLNLVAQAGMAQAGATGKPAAGVSADWGTILKSNPGMTSIAVGYAVTQDIVNTLSTYA